MKSVAGLKPWAIQVGHIKIQKPADKEPEEPLTSPLDYVNWASIHHTVAWGINLLCG
jgi:hypothetical protein